MVTSGKAKDLTGMKFGRLIIIERRGTDKYGNAMWLCRCECGKEVVVRGRNLRRGFTSSCGCYQREKVSENAKDLTGMKFGRLTVIRRHGSSKHGNSMWLCRCKCGNKIVANSSHLKSGDTNSCGCLKKDKMSERFKEMWNDEAFRQMRNEMVGENNPNWKGGITPISIYLRDLKAVEQWTINCKKQANYTCELTGKVGCKLHTHHLKAFSVVVKEAHKLHNIQIHEIIGEYAEEELKLLEEYVKSWHKNNSNAVVLCEEVHKLFHSLYGQGENTKEQFEEFKERYIAGEFKEIIK